MAVMTWDEAEPAPERINFPTDVYECSVVAINAKTAGTGTTGWELIFEVESGPYSGKRLPALNIWSNGGNLKKTQVAYVKRDLGLVGFTDFNSPPAAMPAGRYEVTVSRKDNSALGSIESFSRKVVK